MSTSTAEGTVPPLFASDPTALAWDLITGWQAMTARFKGEIAPLLTEDGQSIRPGALVAFDHVRTEQMAEAETMLSEVMRGLIEVYGSPLTGRTFTLTWAGRERHDGEAPYLWVVVGADLEDARARLQELPSFVEWREQEADDVEELDGPANAHPGLPFGGYFNDLRKEQPRQPVG